jgi:hypothetical protein
MIVEQLSVGSDTTLRVALTIVPAVFHLRDITVTPGAFAIMEAAPDLRRLLRALLGPGWPSRRDTYPRPHLPARQDVVDYCRVRLSHRLARDHGEHRDRPRFNRVVPGDHQAGEAVRKPIPVVPPAGPPDHPPEPTRGGEFGLFAEVINLTDHRNVLGYDYFRSNNPIVGVRLRQGLERWFSILPSIRVSWTGRF